MKIYDNPAREDWDALLARPGKADDAAIRQSVAAIMDDVRQRGDVALKELELKFDKVGLENIQVSEKEIDTAETLLEEDLKEAIRNAKDNIYKFHAAEIPSLAKVETAEEVVCWQKAVAIEKVGLYVPGGTAPLFSTVLMLAVPAQIAGCSEVVLCTPPAADGSIHPAILYAAKISGVHKIFKVGGAQAIAAMACGTATIPKVYKIFGPGNPYVTMAKQLASLQDVAIDMPAGPSEVAIIADSNAKAEVAAADMLSQAEHGTTSQSVLFTTSKEFALEVAGEADRQCAMSSRAQYISKSLDNSKIFILPDLDTAMDMCNAYAPEHLIISCDGYRDLAEKVINAGSVFLGYNTPESAGDYASGTNHTLPTSGFARMYSGVNLDSYIKKITFQEISRKGLEKLAKTITVLAENELLTAHKNAVEIRLKN
ncbi:MAG: histidinol dehydrogenase [Bacteroidetes bacterium]|uniref:Histidinol dehydrogenase n=1 Tax=Candidatus Enterocola intestinipullorum TaxID=2840783 RepID=A0A9D9EFT6_9BACT|nr:histidinol dehydrogenase [Candidatus Enterocola intestinipullorum]